MPRAEDIPPCPTKPNAAAASGRCYEIELITPLFGGGVETRVNDPSFPIRPTSIRGQLQFWWRATVGAQYETRQKLRAAQSAVWGDTTQASRVQVRVEVLEADVPQPCARFERDNKDNSRYRSMPTWNAPFNNTALPYALFPFQGQLANVRRQIEVEPASFIRSAKFQLTVICHKEIDFAKQVEPALWAWVNFGGLGSRTRRGCGAIACKALAPEDANDLKAMWMRHMPKLFPIREWPTMALGIFAGAAFGTFSQTMNEEARKRAEFEASIKAWDQVIGNLRFFRQGEGFARDAGNPPSRSRFPEPDTIRRITDSSFPGHEPREETVIPNGFPRAEFGLPIVFHFKDGKKDANDTRRLEPYDTVLQPFFADEGDRGPTLDTEGFPVGETKDRMASPLILKPLRLANGQSSPLILRLNTELPQRVELQDNKTHSCLTPRRAVPVRDPSFATGNSPINGRSSIGSAIEAFLAYAESKGFTEVTP